MSQPCCCGASKNQEPYILPTTPDVMYEHTHGTSNIDKSVVKRGDVVPQLIRILDGNMFKESSMIKINKQLYMIDNTKDFESGRTRNC